MTDQPSEGNLDREPDVTLSDGRKMVCDLYRVSRREYKALFDDKQSTEDEETVIGKAFGLSGDEVADLPVPDFRRLVKVFFEKAREPLKDPS